MKCSFKTFSKEETIELGKNLVPYLFQGSVITMTGDLGAGKTTLSSGIAQGLGIKEKVSSPTFNIMKCYFNAKLPMYHIDAYRLEEGTNKDLGLEEFIEGYQLLCTNDQAKLQEYVHLVESIYPGFEEAVECWVH